MRHARALGALLELLPHVQSKAMSTGSGSLSNWGVELAATALRHWQDPATLRYSAVFSQSSCRGFAAQPQPEPQRPAEDEAPKDSKTPDSFLETVNSVTDGPVSLYREGRQSGLYRKDPGQENTIQMLQNLYDDLKAAHPAQAKHHPSGLTMVDSVESDEKSGGWFLSFLGGDSSSSAAKKQASTKGLYMYGGVGVGKTMLMDLFVSSAPPEFQLRRAHFHDFMLDVHARLQKRRGSADSLLQVADDLAAEMYILALDEFFVTDVADAVILNRLFGRLWDKGVVLVSTSNRRPDALYEGGLQRVLFLPFIDKLKEHCICHDMASGTDYRRLAQHRLGMYFTSPEREEELHETFTDLTNKQPVAPTSLTVQMGRKLDVKKAGGCICLFAFDELCNKPLAAADYIALAEHYQSVAISRVPVFTAANRPAAYRFMILVDVLYERRIRAFMSAEAQPFELFENIITHEQANSLDASASDNLVVDDNLGFTKDRTISRLVEMQSLEYLLQHAEKHAPELLLALHDRKANRKSRSSSRHERAGLRSSTT